MGSSKGTNDDLALWKYKSDGTLDSSFNSTGIKTHNGAAGGNGIDNGRDIVLDASGNIYVTGASTNAAGNTDMTIWKFLASGSFDTSFNGTGFVSHLNTAGGSGNDSGTRIRPFEFFVGQVSSPEEHVFGPVIAFQQPVITDVSECFVMRKICRGIIADEEPGFSCKYVFLNLSNVGRDFEDNRSIPLLLKVVIVKFLNLDGLDRPYFLASMALTEEHILVFDLLVSQTFPALPLMTRM